MVREDSARLVESTWFRLRVRVRVGVEVKVGVRGRVGGMVRLRGRVPRGVGPRGQARWPPG